MWSPALPACPFARLLGPVRSATSFGKDGVASARLWLPVVVKMHCRATEPFRLSSGTLHTLFKMKGPMTDVASYRSIFLLEGIGKAFRKLLRPALLRCARQNSLDLFFGAMPNSQSGFLTHYMSTFRNIAVSQGLSSMALYVDARSAYYRVVRQRLTGSGWTDQSLCDLLRVMCVPPEALSAVLRWAEGPVLTHELTMHQRRVLEALFRSPCFVLRGLDTPFFSRCGTRPGDSVADVLFAIVLSDCIASLRDRLHVEGLDCGPAGCQSCQPTWADDLAVPACCPAERVEAHAMALCAAVHEELGARALELNYGPGKTELMICWAGPHSRACKAQVFGHEGVLHFQAFGVQHAVRLTASYDHLGTRLCDSGACGSDLMRKAARAVANSRPVAKSVLRWPVISLQHRRRILESLGFSVLCFNVAVWHKFTLTELRCWCQAVDSLARLLLPEDRWTDSPRHPTVYEVCGATGVPEPLALLSHCRLLHAIRIAEADCHVLWELLVAEAEACSTAWLTTLRADAGWLAFWVPNPVTAALACAAADAMAVLLAENGSDIRRWLKAAHRRQHDSLAAWDAFQLQAREAGTFHGVQWVRSRVTEPGCVVCSECSATFASGSHLAAHMHHFHQHRSLQCLYAHGTRCRWCLKQYWTVNRLREHLAAGGPCLAFLIASVPPLSDACLGAVDAVHLQQLADARSAGKVQILDRLPPLALCGPRRPCPSELVCEVSAALASLSESSRLPLWKSAHSLLGLGFSELEPALDAWEVAPTTRASVSAPPPNPDGRAWIDLARNA